MTRRLFTDEKAARLSLYPTCGRAVMALPAPLPPREGRDAMRIADASVLARGSARSERIAAVSGTARLAGRASGAHLTGPCRTDSAEVIRAERPRDAAPGAGSRTAPVNKNAPALLVAAGRMTHRGEVDECSES